MERHASGVLRVVDHKTGNIPDPQPEMLGEGEVLQPALYALAAEKILGEPVAFGRLYYSTIAQNYQTIDVPLNDWTRRRTEQALRVIDDALHNGFLPAAPRKDGCKRCDYLPVCGPYEEERLREKSQPELKALKELPLMAVTPNPRTPPEASAASHKSLTPNPQPLTPFMSRKDGCKRCEYLPVCGPYEEERLREKSQPELKALKELRSWL